MTKDTLIREYFQNNLTLKQIAEKYNISYSKTYKLLKEFGLETKKEINANKELSEFQEKFVYAKLLGDGCITKSRHHVEYHFEFGHEEKQREYAKYCANILEGFGTYSEKERKRDPKIYKKSEWIECVFKSIHNSDFSRIYRHCYEHGRKIVNKEILDIIDDFGLAVWYMDDGHKVTGQKASYLNTLCFTLNENKMIVEWLWERFQVRSNVVKAGKSRNGRDDLYRIRISSSTWDRFCSIIEPHIQEELKYKISKDTVRS